MRATAAAVALMFLGPDCADEEGRGGLTARRGWLLASFGAVARQPLSWCSHVAPVMLTATRHALMLRALARVLATWLAVIVLLQGCAA